MMEKKKTRFSFSALSNFQNCPRAYMYKYIEELRPAFSSIEAHMGTSVHAALEWAYKERLEGKDPDNDDILAHYKDVFWNSEDFQFAKIIKSGTTSGEYFEQGKSYLIEYLQRVLPNDTSETLYLEHVFEVALDDEYRFKGIIDRVARDDDGYLRVVDYKTGKVGDPLDNLQLPSYALYIFSCNMDAEIRLCIEDLRSNRTLTVPYKRKEVKQVRADLLAAINEIQKATEFPPKPSVLCFWCGFNQMCDAAPPEIKEGKGFTPKAANQSQMQKDYVPDFNPNTNQNQLFQPPNQPISPQQYQQANAQPETNAGANVNASMSAPMNGNIKGNTIIETNNADNPKVDGMEAMCPQCGSQLRQRNGRFGAFLGCTNFPNCRYTYNLESGPKPERPPQDITPETEGKDICPECGSLLKLRKGKFGQFYGCSSYPGCRFTRQVSEGGG